MLEPYAPLPVASSLTLLYPDTQMPQSSTTLFALLSIDSDNESIVGTMLSGTDTVTVLVDVEPICVVPLYVYKYTVIVPLDDDVI